MGAQASKASAKDREEAAGRGQKLQFKYNLWPLPIRKEGTTHSTEEHQADLSVDEWVGHAKGSDHKFDTMVAALNTDEAPALARLFVYGKAHYKAEEETRSEIIMLKYDNISHTDAFIRYTDYFSTDAKKLVDPSTLDNAEHQAASNLRAELTSAPTDPNDDDRKVRMAKALGELIGNWKDSEESSIKARGARLPWKRRCASNGLEKVIAAHCAEDCTISMPLQQIVVKAKDLPAQWRARLQGKGMFTHFGQTEFSMTYEAYGKLI
jgi:hypothetical protein